jgi:Fe-S-cluster-containing dehydrogenase component
VPIGVNRTHVKYIETGTYPDSGREFTVHRCNHCEDAPCTTICPTTALFIRSDGIVDFDDDRCIGCKSCMQACPYDALYIDPNKGTAAKCNYCAHRVENSYEPACVIVCPTESIVSGDLNDPSSKIAMMVASHETTVRKPESGAKPNVFYIEASEEMLDPSATEFTGGGMWTEQEVGVGHFAKYAESRASEADTPSMLVQLALDKKAKKANPRDQAIIRDVMAKLKEDAGKPTRSYDQPSKGILWDSEVAGYIVTKGMASGLYLFMIAGALVFSDEFLVESNFFTVVGSIVLVLMGLTGFLLVKDLDRPERFLYVLLRPNFNSWLVKGAYIIAAFSVIVVLHILLDLSGLDPNLHYPLAFIGAPLAWMTGTYTGWLLKQAKGRTEWARRSSARIAFTGTIELLAFGFLIPTLAFIQSGTPDPVLVTRAPYMIYAIVWGILIWFGFKHIRGDLRKAQMEPLL